MKNSASNNIAVLEWKLLKLEISPERINRIKNSVLIILIYVIVKVIRT